MTMNKTKVRISPLLLDYRQMMEQWVDEARDEKLRVAALAEIILEPFPCVDIPDSEQAGLLRPPRIESLWPELYLRNGETHGLIQINTSDVFGIACIYVTLRDQAGNLLERGYAMRVQTCETHWGYIPDVALRAGTTVVVRAVAMDSLGGLSIAHETCTVCDTCQAPNDHEGMA
jgi:hypothetical protein